MDHAGWVQRQIAAEKRRSRTRAAYRDAQQGRGWYAAPDELSSFQRRVFDILGIACGGIYNAPISWMKVDWRFGTVFRGGHGLAVPIGETKMQTWDFDGLTTLVFLCHEARIRLEMRAHTHGYFLMVFHQRAGEGPIHERHPGLDEAVSAFRDALPAWSPIRYESEAAE